MRLEEFFFSDDDSDLLIELERPDGNLDALRLSQPGGGVLRLSWQPQATIGPPLWLVDASHHQGRNLDVAGLHDEGVHGFYFKASQNVVDTQFYNNAEKATDAGAPFGPYHFLDKDWSAAAQALMFWDIIKGTGFNLPPMLDLEWDSGVVPSATHLRQFYVAWRSLTDYPLMLYSIYSILSPLPGWVGQMLLHQANYTNGHYETIDGVRRFVQDPIDLGMEPPPIVSPMPPQWTVRTLWQFSSMLRTQSYGGNLDGNRFNGTMASLLGLINYRMPTLFAEGDIAEPIPLVLNVRAEPAVGDNVISTVSRGRPGLVLAGPVWNQYEWYEVLFDNSQGWCAGEFLQQSAG